MILLSIIRDKHEAHYFKVSNAAVENPNISFKAKGILAYLLSKPNTWTIRIEDIIKHSKDGKEAVRSGIDELVKAGYITKKQNRSSRGAFGEWEYTVYENPIQPETGFPPPVNTTLAIPDSSNPVYKVIKVQNQDFARDNFSGLDDKKTKKPSVFAEATREYGAESVRSALEVINWYIDDVYTRATGKLHPRESKAKRITFAVKLLKCENETSIDIPTIASALKNAAYHSNSKPYVYYVTTPKVLGYWLIKDTDVGFECVRNTDYSPTDEQY